MCERAKRQEPSIREVASVFIETLGAEMLSEKAPVVEPTAQIKVDEAHDLELYTEPTAYDMDLADSLGVHSKMSDVDWRDHIDLDKVTPEARDYVAKLLDKYKTTFSYSKDDYRPLRGICLSLNPADKTPFSERPYPVPPHLQPIMDELLGDMLRKGWIKRSPLLATYISNAFLVKHSSSEDAALAASGQKRDYKYRSGTVPAHETIGGVEGHQEKVVNTHDAEVKKPRYRMVFAFQKVNTRLRYEGVAVDSYSVLNPFEQLSKVRGATYQTKLDVSHAFNQLLLSKDSRQYLAFHAGSPTLYCFLVAGLGLNLLPAVYSRIIFEIIPPELRQYVVSFIDDLHISSNGTAAMHAEILDKLLHALQERGVLLSAKKAQFFVREVEYVGVMLSGNGVRIKKERIEYISRLPLPQNKAQMSSLLGFLNYNSIFIQNFAEKTREFYELLKPTSIYALSDHQVAMLRQLIKELFEAPTLVHLNPELRIYICTDSAHHSFGASIFHVIDGRRAMLGYYSHKYSPDLARILTAAEKELYALIRTCENNPLYFSTNLNVVLIVDIQCLITAFYAAATSVAHKLNRWLLKLSSFSPQLLIRWERGTSANMYAADYLSRHPYCAYERQQNEVGEKPLLSAAEAKECLDNPSQFSIPRSFLNKDTFSLHDVQEYVHSCINGESETPVPATVGPAASRHVVNEAFESIDINMLRTYCSSILSAEKVQPKVAIEALFGVELAELASNASIVIDPTRRDTLFPDVPNLSISTYLTPEVLLEEQKNDSFLGPIIRTLLTTPRSQLPKKMLRYKLLSFGILGYSKEKRFQTVDSHDKNFRPYLPLRSAVLVLALAHLLGHTSVSGMIARTKALFYIPRALHVATSLYSSCKSCRLHTLKLKKQYPESYARSATTFREVFLLDHMHVSEAIWKRKKVSQILSVCDLHSRFIMSEISANPSGRETADILQQIFSTYGGPKTLASDNAVILANNEHVRKICRMYNVQTITTISYRPGSHSAIELVNKYFRRLLLKNAEMLSVDWPKVFYYTKYQYNLIPRYYNLPTPNFVQSKPILTTPYFIVYGVDADLHFDYFLDRGYTPQNVERLRQYTRKLMTEFSQQQLLVREEKDREVGETDYAVGDVVLLRKFPYQKNDVLYVRNLYIITSIYRRQVMLTSLYYKKSVVRTHIDHIRKFKSSPLIEQLPQEIQAVFGTHIRSPEKGGRVPPSDIAPQRKVDKRVTRQAVRKALSKTEASQAKDIIIAPPSSSDSSAGTSRMTAHPHEQPPGQWRQVQPVVLVPGQGAVHHAAQLPPRTEQAARKASPNILLQSDRTSSKESSSLSESHPPPAGHVEPPQDGDGPAGAAGAEHTVSTASPASSPSIRTIFKSIRKRLTPFRRRGSAESRGQSQSPVRRARSVGSTPATSRMPVETGARTKRSAAPPFEKPRLVKAKKTKAAAAPEQPPAAPRRSSRVRKPPRRLIDEM